MHTPTAIPTPQPPAPSPQPPPQRKYTVSPKVLAAARANLAKANAISKEVRYRPTPKRLIACRANLVKALVALKDDQRAWAPRFRLGTHTVSLRRSLVLAGESEAQYDAHLERFRRALAPRDTVERKLTGALANPWVAPGRVEGVLVRESEGLLGRREPSVCDFRNWTWQVSGPSGETFEGEDDLAAGVARMDRLAASALPSAPPAVEAFPWGVSTNDAPVADAASGGAREDETFQRNVSTEAIEACAAHL